RVIREQLQSAIDVIVQLERLPNGRRIISAVTEVQGLEGDTVLLQDVFAIRNGMLAATGLRPRFLDRLHDEHIELPARIFRMESQGGAAPGEPRGRLRRLPSARELAEPERAR